MKQIIDGKQYDTEKATPIYDFKCENGLEGTIYMTCKGSYIGYEDGQKSIIGPEQLKVFLGYQLPDVYVGLFGEVEEG